MDDLIAFYQTRLDEAERRAPNEHDNPDEEGFYACPATRSKPYGDLPFGEANCDCGLAYRRHMVLADIAAKRAILDGFESDEANPPWQAWDDDAWKAIAWVIRVLVQPFAGHPDFRDEWRLPAAEQRV